MLLYQAIAQKSVALPGLRASATMRYRHFRYGNDMRQRQRGKSILFYSCGWYRKAMGD